MKKNIVVDPTSGECKRQKASMVCFVVVLMLMMLLPKAVKADDRHGRYNQKAFSYVSEHDKTVRGAECLAVGIFDGSIDAPVSVAIALMSHHLYLQIGQFDQDSFARYLDITPDALDEEVGAVVYETAFMAELNYHLGRFQALEDLVPSRDAITMLERIAADRHCESHTVLSSLYDYPN